MSNVALRPLLTATLCLGALLSSAACTLIVSPKDDVQRCGSADDCDDTGDNRYVAECRFNEGSSEDSNDVEKICVAAFKPTTCDPMVFTGQGDEHPLKVALDEADGSGRYVCPEDTNGTRGCPPISGTGCLDGLVVNDFNVCDVADANQPAFTSSSIGADDPQDVLDQFCKSFFCDDEFVCNTESFSCVRCDDEKLPGEGGCGLVYTQGALSCIYVLGDELEAECEGPDANLSEPTFGTCA